MIYGFISALFLGEALAHHTIGGMMPSGFVQGLLSGIGHPLIGFDHFVFICAAGIAATLIGMRFLLPLLFVAATILGTGLFLLTPTLPFSEMGIAVSLCLSGILLASGCFFSKRLYAVLFFTFGLFHGFAYGEAVLGAESTAILAYLLGFSLIQYLLALCAGMLCCGLAFSAKAERTSSAFLWARIVGGSAVGVGGFILSQQILTGMGWVG